MMRTAPLVPIEEISPMKKFALAIAALIGLGVVCQTQAAQAAAFAPAGHIVEQSDQSMLQRVEYRHGYYGPGRGRGSYGRGHYGHGSYGRGHYGHGSYGRGRYGRGPYGRGHYDHRGQ
jgi:hypothetical protein